MTKRISGSGVRVLAVALALLACGVLGANTAWAASASEISRESSEALAALYRTVPDAKALGNKAVGVLVFPSIVKGGFIVAGEFGDGALRKGGKTTGYYRSLAASYGFQAGAQAFGYALFFMDQASLNYLDKSEGFELGTGPSLVILDEGFGKNFSTTTVKKGVYAFIFDQKGLMGGIGIRGAKITRIHPK
jgi:lipid-binding SYLF domain-containing protein